MTAQLTQLSEHDSALAILRQLIASDGPLVARLKTAAAGRAWTYGRKSELMLGWLRSLEYSFGQSATVPTPSGIIARLHENPDFAQPLLAACLIYTAWPDYQSETLMERAVHQLVAPNIWDEYTHLLGEFLHESVLRAGRRRLSQQTYEGLHTRDFGLVDDANVYLHQLPVRMGQHTEVLGVPTGFAELDAAISGLSGLTFLAGAAGVGKTDLAITICTSVLGTQPDTAVVFVELDLGKNQVYDRIVCNLAGVSEAELLNADVPPAVRQKVEQGLQRFRELNRRLDVVSLMSSQPLDVNLFAQRLRNFQQHCGCRRLVVVVDYVQLLTPPQQAGDPLEQDRQRMQLLSDIRTLTANTSPDRSPAVLAISEVRKIDSGRDLVLEDLLGAARQQYVADNVIMLQPGKDQPVTAETSPVELLVVKTRRGRRGRIPLTFRYRRHAFTSAASDGERAEPAAAAPRGRRSRQGA